MQLLGIIFRGMDNFGHFLTLIWPPGCPKGLETYDLSKISNSIKLAVTNYISVQIYSWWGSVLEGWTIVLPLISRVPEKGSKNVVWQKQIPKLNLWSKIMYLCKCSASSYYFIGRGELLPHPRSLDPYGLENSARMGNRSWYEAILKKNRSESLSKRKPLTN